MLMPPDLDSRIPLHRAREPQELTHSNFISLQVRSIRNVELPGNSLDAIWQASPIVPESIWIVSVRIIICSADPVLTEEYNWFFVVMGVVNRIHNLREHGIISRQRDLHFHHRISLSVAWYKTVDVFVSG